MNFKIPLIAFLVTLIILNALDGFLTAYYVESHIALEANPIMRKALEWGIPHFLTIKLTLVPLLGIFIYQYNRFFAARAGLVFLTIVYTVLISWWFYQIVLLN